VNEKELSVIEARVRYLDGIQFVGETSSGHVVFIDGSTDSRGNNAGIRPTDLLLIGLGSCSGMSVVSILKKKKQDVTGFEIIIKGKKEDDWPRKITDIGLELIVRGHNISEDAVKRAIELSMERYCTVKATLESPARITFNYRVEEDA